MGALPFSATGFFNISHLLEKAYPQLPIQHCCNTSENCPSFGSQSSRLQCLLHVHISPQQRNANAKVQAQSKARPAKEEYWQLLTLRTIWRYVLTSSQSPLSLPSSGSLWPDSKWTPLKAAFITYCYSNWNILFFHISHSPLLFYQHSLRTRLKQSHQNKGF